MTASATKEDNMAVLICTLPCEKVEDFRSFLKAATTSSGSVGLQDSMPANPRFKR